MMRKNPNICLEIESVQNMANCVCIIINGKYEEVTTRAGQTRILKIINDKFTPVIASSTLAPRGLNDTPRILEKEKKAIVFKVKIEKMNGRYQKSS